MQKTTPRTCYIVIDVASYRILYQGTSADVAAEHLEPGTVFGLGDTHSEARINALGQIERIVTRTNVHHVTNAGDKKRAPKKRKSKKRK